MLAIVAIDCSANEYEEAGKRYWKVSWMYVDKMPHFGIDDVRGESLPYNLYV